MVLGFMCAALEAQETMYGVRGGVTFSSLSFDKAIDFENDNRIGGYFGGFADFGISDSFSIMTEVQYASEGAKDKPFRLGMIQIPVQLRWAITDGVKLGAGPQLSFITWKSQDVFNQYVFSVVGGLEVMLTDMVFIDARYNHGISNLLQEGLLDNEAFNRSFQLGIGLKM